MEDGFISDCLLFIPSFDFLLDKNDIDKIYETIEKKHKYEAEIEKKLEDKKIDLFIWQGVLVRKLSISKNTVMNTIMHETYNKFYNQIKDSSTLKELQVLEKEIFYTYSNFAIYYTEVTNNYTLNKILKYIHLNIENYISLKNMSEELNLSKPYISLVFKKHLGTTVMDYVTNLKVNRAKALLSNTALSIMEISQILGFYDSSHFSKVFKNITGMNPRGYRDKYIEN
ncbi:helix-turn-helix transcriptional regulator [Clostridium sp. 19966]|uniref:helix-turn-helix domain-containing protein n=1 Tax=Clostridium sp. 19966 TaxID=2768166 RepID=UPI0028E03CA5|nr:AraC family transcriptional regulator [Clostridium sp. 19966]MDT8715958.1 helix-turn-helix transcriptional regulator [Clostridium sp. 19966]